MSRVAAAATRLALDIDHLSGYECIREQPGVIMPAAAPAAAPVSRITGLLGRRDALASRRPSVAPSAWSLVGGLKGLRPRRWCAGGLPPRRESRPRGAPRGVPGVAIVPDAPRCRMVDQAQLRTRHVPMNAVSACPGRCPGCCRCTSLRDRDRERERGKHPGDAGVSGAVGVQEAWDLSARPASSPDRPVAREGSSAPPPWP